MNRFQRLTTTCCQELDVLIHQIGGVEDHVHLVLSIPPRHSVSDIVQKIKGTSSKAFGQDHQDPQWTGWQGEYGVLTIGERSLPAVIEYVQNQEMRHRAGDLLTHFEQIDRRYDP